MKYLFWNKWGKISKIYISTVLILLLVIAGAAEACTLWGATGSATAGNMTIIAKNRDWKPVQKHYLRKVIPESGYSYVGLFAVGKSGSGLKAGVNEKGLAVVTATVSVIPKSKRATKDKSALSSHKILTSFASVDEVLAHVSQFKKVSFYMIADSEKIAVVEVAPGGRNTVRVIDDGIIAQTNHYISPEMQKYNRKIPTSSKNRYKRITQLLQAKAGSLTMKDFEAFSNDHNAGPDNSIFRTGSTPKKSQTVAKWIIAIPKNDNPRLYVTMKNPGKPFRAFSGTLGPSFWRTDVAKAAKVDG
ncbi:C45 family autoproteolytic acyltransferase/hydolase [Thermovirga sp.]|uniref:C45 family autoproteolytic acyltransferase/hydolase n=1 Tax=Thermovirga sp. TaxID=2699834 RepID=UPI0025E480EF|nr:C45 family autoproteolytic acyltransferase/hydolase [Thermovirga sp.]MBO8154010.1 hypothetical protein [Thermovirga sp.]